MKQRVNVLGVGITPFSRPGEGPSFLQLASEASQLAIADAGIRPEQLKTAYAGFAGGHVQRGCGVHGIELIGIEHVGALCSGCGTSAFAQARLMVESGSADCVLAVGFEALTGQEPESRDLDLSSAFATHLPVLRKAHQLGDDALTRQVFAGAAREYMARHRARRESFAMVALKAHAHGLLDPQALYARQLTLDEVLESEALHDPLTRLQCSLPANGAAAVVLCSDEFARSVAGARPVRIVAQATARDTAGVGDGTFTAAAGYVLSTAAAQLAYEQAGFGSNQIDVCELDDSSTFSEVLACEALGFCREGSAEKLIEDGDNTYGGDLVINPSGGTLARGNARGATPLAQCVELVRQLRGEAGQRQVKGARTALQHSQSLMGGSMVTIYQRDWP